jgi:hypothetical protein
MQIDLLWDERHGKGKSLKIDGMLVLKQAKFPAFGGKIV